MTSSVSTPAQFNMPEALGIDLNASNYGPPIPIIYGTNKTSGNCAWYGDFTATQVSGGGKGGGGTQGVSYNYSASYMFAICEGPVIGFGNVWQDSSFQDMASLDPDFTALGTSTQAPWSHFGGTQALGYRYTALVAFLYQNLGGSANTPNYQFEMNGFHMFNSPTIVDANPSDVLNDICTDPNHGMGFNYLGSLTQYSDYCVANSLFLSPVYDQEQNASMAISDLMSWTNSACYWSEGKLKITPYGDVSVIGNGVTYTPNLTVQHAFTDADFLYDPGNPPVEVDRKAAADALNTVRVAYSDRSYYYYQMLAEAKDENDSLQNGIRSVQSVNIPGCTQASVARLIAQNMLQREFYIRNRYKWKTSWRWAFLEPTDVVSLQDSTLGLNGALVRITQIDEAENGTLSFEAEELPIGVGHSTAYAPPTNSGYTLDVLVDPGPVVEPLFFRYPGFLPGVNGPTLGIAVTASGVNWGSAQLWLSYDGTNYFYFTTITNQSRYGLLDTNLPNVADPDTTSTPQLTLETGQLTGGTKADADNLITLSMVDSEVISYETAALQSGETYQLSYLRRGCYNTAAASHSIGAPFVRLDQNIVMVPFDPSQVGNTIYAKFLSYNIFGHTPRTLASETAYSYVIGASPSLPDVPSVPNGFAASAAPDGVYLTWTNINPAAGAVTSIERSTAPSGPFTVIAQVGRAHMTYHDIWTPATLAAGSIFYYRARALGSLPQAGFSAYTSVISSAANAVSLSAITGHQNNLAPDSGFQFGEVYWRPSGAAYGVFLGGIDGSNNALLIGPGTGGVLNGHWISLPLNVTPGTYTLSAVVIGNAQTSALATVQCDNGSGTIYGSFTIPLTGGLQRLSCTVTIPTGVDICYLRFSSNGATLVSGTFLGMQQIQLEIGPVMTAYRQSADIHGYSVLTGSGPVTIPENALSYTTATTQVAWSWVTGGIILADGTNVQYPAQSSVGCNGLTASTSYWFYPYYETSAAVVTFMLGGIGTGALAGAAYTAASTTAVAGQNQATNIPMSLGGLKITTPASGSGGGIGGGNRCLSPDCQVVVRAAFEYDELQAEQTLRAGELQALKHEVMTPQGWQPIRQVQRAVKSDWIRVGFSNDEEVICTPSHLIKLPDGTDIRARDLKLGSVVAADNQLASVVLLEAISKKDAAVMLDVPGHYLYLRAGGVLQHNANQKP